jgi:cytochrome c biogenesis protein CcdA
VLAAALIVAGIAVVDSLNPGTIGPALVLAVSEKPVRRILEFSTGFFVVNVAGGIALVLGFSLLPTPSDHLKHVGEIVAGVALLAGAFVLLTAHARLVRPTSENTAARRRASSALLFGAGLALAELPTAFPYFAAIAAIEAAGLSTVQEIVLVVGFNVLFLAPVLVIAVLIAFFPWAWDRVVDPVRRWLAAHWPRVLATILAVGGVALIVVGVAGLSS